MNLRQLFFFLNRLNPIRHTATICGHHTPQTGHVSAFGRTITTKMPRNGSGSVDYCLDCLSAMAIQCAWCGGPIFIGDLITLYTPRDNFQISEHATVFHKNPLQLVGCVDSVCAEFGAIDRAGFWVPNENGKGQVCQVQTVIEAILNAKTPSAIVISNVRDAGEVICPKLIPF